MSGAWRALLGLHVLGLIGAAGGLWFTRPPPPPPPLSEAELSHAAEVLDQRRASTRRVPPLDEAQRSAVMSFLGLQTDAAGLSLKGWRWGETQRSDALEITHLELYVEGDALNLPVLVDGLYRQSHPVMVTALALLHRGGHEAEGILHLRLFSPAPAPDWALLPGETPAERALAAAERERLAAGFDGAWSPLDAARGENRRAVMRALPALIRGLPRARKGWLGLAMEDGVLVPLAGERPG
ncbi:MAG: hypothetical protein H6741_03470 [Alphaproteobacteria bacterium]|nr:hypothetical protein [Alphaproteobacteria bacterium]MCB9791764.1 hypothetical protein [Alphaproteobacteria bacterium]